MITVKKMDETTKIEEVVNTESRFETRVLAEAAIRDIKLGEVIQLERRGYFFVDKLPTENSPMLLHFVPDGKSKTVSHIETKIDVKSLSKGEETEKSLKKKQEKKDQKEKKKENKEAKKEAKKDKDATKAPTEGTGEAPEK